MTRAPSEAERSALARERAAALARVMRRRESEADWRLLQDNPPPKKDAPHA
ncbi:MAG: hypothetical protein KF889_25575 [Alphaproteobacteria bacterium]|nr:hypothetical protein [Alphaproteobacteria bacterium]MCW5739634.1 hypothetical protein [Alphaproteobacteria bacterium]